MPKTPVTNVAPGAVRRRYAEFEEWRDLTDVRDKIQNALNEAEAKRGALLSGPRRLSIEAAVEGVIESVKAGAEVVVEAKVSVSDEFARLTALNGTFYRRQQKRQERRIREWSQLVAADLRWDSARICGRSSVNLFAMLLAVEVAGREAEFRDALRMNDIMFSSWLPPGICPLIRGDVARGYEERFDPNGMISKWLQELIEYNYIALSDLESLGVPAKLVEHLGAITRPEKQTGIVARVARRAMDLVGVGTGAADAPANEVSRYSMSDRDLASW